MGTVLFDPIKERVWYWENFSKQKKLYIWGSSWLQRQIAIVILSKSTEG